MASAALSVEHRRYLRLLGVAASEPTIALLRALVAAHLYRVPFENVSKLLLYERERAGRPISITEFLDGIEHHDLGGTCYSSNPFLCDLLAALGFDASLLAADMASPNVHTSIRVCAGGKSYHVDVGYGAPFLEPMALDRLPHAVTNGRERYELTASAERGRYKMTHYVDDEPHHGYVVHPPARSLAFFTPIIVGSFERGRTFMEWLRVSRQFPDGSADLRNRDLVVCRGGVTRESPVETMADLRQVVDDVFGLPRCPIERAAEILEEVTGRSLFYRGA